MNVFVLCTGRCGSATFYKACTHITNYSAGHETRLSWILNARLRYPKRHIEADARLAWRLGSLDKMFGRDAYYVHLMRNPADVAKSYLTKLKKDTGLAKDSKGQGRAWFEILGRPKDEGNALYSSMVDFAVAATDNINMFLRDKRSVVVKIEGPHEAFEKFWYDIEAEGDMASALGEFAHRYNSTEHPGYERPEA